MSTDAEGYVYVQTNDANSNEVVVFGRDADGRLQRLDSYLTGGKGSGAPHLQSQGSIVLADEWLFVTNAGSDDLTAFALDGARLKVVDRAASGGRAPRSVAVHAGHVFVLNGGGRPNIAVFSFDGNKLAAVVQKVANSKEYQDFMASRGFGVVWADPALTATFMAGSDRNLGEARKAVGLAK